MVDKDKAAANAWIKKAITEFGDRFFIEINRTTSRRPSEAVLDRISRAYNIPLVGTSPCAYSTPDDYELLELLSAIDQKRLIDDAARSEEHTSELQSLMRISYAVFCLKKKKTQ